MENEYQPTCESCSDRGCDKCIPGPIQNLIYECPRQIDAWQHLVQTFPHHDLTYLHFGPFEAYLIRDSNTCLAHWQRDRYLLTILAVPWDVPEIILADLERFPL